MTSVQPDNIWIHKNFDMCVELNIAGEFIYDGINTLNQIDNTDQRAMMFSMLYHFCVGIERMQKIILTISENITAENFKNFEKDLKTHSHKELQSRIKNTTGLKLESRELSFLELLSTFYKNGRYDRFNLVSHYENEEKSVSKFIRTHIMVENIKYDTFNQNIFFTNQVKSLFGRIIGSISKKYYDCLTELCTNKRLFAYELEPNSKAQKVFLNTFYKNSLQEQKKEERIALGEFLIFLMNTKQKNPVLRHMKSINSLEMEPEFIQQYVDELSQGIISQSMIDEVYTLYEEFTSSEQTKHRMESIQAFGNTDCFFDVGVINECKETMEDLFLNKIDSVSCCEKLNSVDKRIHNNAHHKAIQRI